MANPHDYVEPAPLMIDAKTPATSGPRTPSGRSMHATYHKGSCPLEYGEDCWKLQDILAIEQEAADAEAKTSAFDAEASGALRSAVLRHSTDPIPECDDGTHHTLALARNVIEARPDEGVCDHCGQFAPCTERRIAVAFVEVMDAALASPAKTPPDDSRLDPDSADGRAYRMGVPPYTPEPEGLERAYFHGYMAGAGDFTATPPPKSEVEKYARNYARLTANQPSDPEGGAG